MNLSEKKNGGSAGYKQPCHVDLSSFDPLSVHCREREILIVLGEVGGSSVGLPSGVLSSFFASLSLLSVIPVVALSLRRPQVSMVSVKSNSGCGEELCFKGLRGDLCSRTDVVVAAYFSGETAMVLRCGGTDVVVVSYFSSKAAAVFVVAGLVGLFF
ncbi:unnamed protein product [Eruca vesicaria subsp. sativa]|uniref:Transmembrane protein n=1 Tax=Eruca vesicaria subsp. sativa TaxID=29727 RepID=A0ABC8LBA1_ERUVS|nr:unnamed protein product [Eruca vesicaria subsp. sativa]